MPSLFLTDDTETEQRLELASVLSENLIFKTL
jgi:hypothetical protein